MSWVSQVGLALQAPIRMLALAVGEAVEVVPALARKVGVVVTAAFQEEAAVVVASLSLRVVHP